MDLKCLSRNPALEALNLLLSLVMWGIACALLVWASRASVVGSWIELFVAALLFSFAANTIFALLHESTHGLLHSNSALNDSFGVVSAAFFPTGFQFQRACHLGHHARNRTELETFDYFYPDDCRVLKVLQWYAILTPIYWLSVVCGWLVFAVCPGALRALAAFGKGALWAEHSSGTAYLEGLESIPPIRARLELLFTALFQMGLFVLLELDFKGWTICYLAFAFNWSALQYADHAFSPLDVREGAWDLRVPTWWRWIFLNYHCHRAHHTNPQIQWFHLPRLVDSSQERPHFFSLYARMWKGPKPAPGPPASLS